MIFFPTSLLFFFSFIIYPFEKSLYYNIYPAIAAKRGVSIPSYEEAAFNASMMLVNSHPSVGTPFKLPQNVKYIGGYHIDRKIKSLPEVRCTHTRKSVIMDIALSYHGIGSALCIASHGLPSKTVGP